MIERERLALVIALEHKFGKLFVLFEHCRLILFGKRGGVARTCHNGFHAQFGKAEIEHHLYVLQKIGVCVSKRAAHVIPLALARFNKLLELRNDCFPAALARIVHAIPVVNFLPSVKAQNNVAHLPICKIDNIIVNKHSVGRERKTKVLARLLFNAACVFNKLLYDIKIHQRLTPEKVNLKVAARTGVFNQKIQRAFTDIKAHQCAFAVVFPLACKAIGAIEIAGMRNMQAQSLNNAGCCGFQCARHRFKRILNEELARIFKLGYLVIAFINIGNRHGIGRASAFGAAVFFGNFRNKFAAGF